MEVWKCFYASKHNFKLSNCMQVCYSTLNLDVAPDWEYITIHKWTNIFCRPWKMTAKTEDCLSFENQQKLRKSTQRGSQNESKCLPDASALYLSLHWYDTICIIHTLNQYIDTHIHIIIKVYIISFYELQFDMLHVGVQKTFFNR